MINSFKRYLKAIVPNIVFKSAREAEKYETEASRLAGDEYVSACLETDTWLMIRPDSLTEPLLNQVGIYDKALIHQIQEDSFLVPEAKRARLISLRRRYIIDNFEETNNYYRMLMGLPDVDAEFVYLDPRELRTFGYDVDKDEDFDNDNTDALTPIHKLPQYVLNSMEANGYLDEVYQAYAGDSNYNAEYIKYLGLKRIDVIQARMAGHFELLYVPRPDNANRFNRDFSMYYEEARQYFLNQVYNFHYSSRYDFYESYIGFFILVMAIQRMVNSMFEVMVDRDFYDLETCRMFLDAYGVPFIEMFTLQQQKTLVKNLNILISKKCTSQVLYDILSLLEYDKYDLTKYLLVKQHKTAQINDESEPKPIFIYRTILDDDGNASYELDKTKTYDYYFVGVPMNDTDITLVEQTDANAHSYEEVTNPDELWIEDEDLVEKLQDDEINYVETKYTNISITLHMQDVVFEHVYLQKMLCDKSKETSLITVDIPLITSTPISLFELEVVLICIMSRYNNMIPDLITTPSKALAVLGFNFDADLEAIKTEITSNPKIYSQKLIQYIKNIQFYSVSDVNEMYSNVRELSRLMIEVMQNTTSEQVYHAYKKLYTALLVTDVHNEVFNLPDGSTPETYMDWLKAYDYSMYEYIDALDSDACVDKINYIATKYSTWFTSTKYTKYLNPIDLTVVNGLIKLLRWFKSYTIEIKEMEVVYLFDSKYYNMMKMMNRMWFHERMVIHETDIGYHEWVQSMSTAMKISETRNKLFEILRMSESMSYKEMGDRMRDAIHLVAKLKLKDNMLWTYGDAISSFSSGYMKLSDKSELLRERASISSEITMKDTSTTQYDNAISISGDKMSLVERMIRIYIDVLYSKCSCTLKDSSMRMEDRFKIIYHDS
jgi:hypothetical protein